MIPELEPVWKRWEETHAALLEAIAELPADRWDWRPAPGATTAAEIVAHIANAETNYVRRISGDTAPWARWEVSDLESAGAALTGAALTASECVERLLPADLVRICAQEWRPLGPSVEGPLDVLWFLEQMTRHKAYHLGQINYLNLLSAPGTE